MLTRKIPVGQETGAPLLWPMQACWPSLLLLGSWEASPTSPEPFLYGVKALRGCSANPPTSRAHAKFSASAKGVQVKDICSCERGQNPPCPKPQARISLVGRKVESKDLYPWERREGGKSPRTRIMQQHKGSACWFWGQGRKIPTAQEPAQTQGRARLPRGWGQEHWESSACSSWG